MPAGFRHGLRLAGAAASLMLAGGCATASLDRARNQFYQGRPEQAVQQLESVRPSEKDEVLLLMERGMARQMAEDYRASSLDFMRASNRLEELQTYSLSRGGATWAINDTVQNFRGKPYERTLLHAFSALNFIALGAWDSAAVEARRLIETVRPDVRGDYPDDPFSRYVAGVCFELIHDASSAAFQYRQLAELVPGLGVDPNTGQFTQPDETAPASADGSHELICFIMLGRAARGSQILSPALASRPAGALYFEVHADGGFLGRSHTLSDTWHLAAVTEKEEAARRAIKTAARIAAKEAVAQSLESQSAEYIDDLVRLVLIGLLEQPDVRSWSTLPRWLHVARVPCPPGLREYELVLKAESGQELSRRAVNRPIQRKGRTYVSFHRQL